MTIHKVYYTKMNPITQYKVHAIRKYTTTTAHTTTECSRHPTLTLSIDQFDIKTLIQALREPLCPRKLLNFLNLHTTAQIPSWVKMPLVVRQLFNIASTRSRTLIEYQNTYIYRVNKQCRLRIHCIYVDTLILLILTRA